MTVDAMLHREYATHYGETLRYRLHQPPPGTGPCPLVLFLHGAGERGDDNTKQLVHGVGPILTHAAARGMPCYLIAPQCPARMQWVNVPWVATAHTMPEFPSTPLRLVIEMLDAFIAEHPVDRNRVFVTGISMGGFGTWDLIQRRPGLFAAAVPICGGGDVAQAGHLTSLPIWAWHGDADTVVLPSRSRDMVNAIRAAGGTIRHMECAGVGHNSWVNAYSDTTMLDWLFSQERRAV